MVRRDTLYLNGRRRALSEDRYEGIRRGREDRELVRGGTSCGDGMRAIWEKGRGSNSDRVAEELSNLGCATITENGFDELRFRESMTKIAYLHLH